MNYNCFMKEITQRVREHVPEGCTVEVKPVRKNNGLMLESMVICRPQDTVSANIYLDQIYERYLDGMTMDEAVEEILSAWTSAMPAMQIDADDLLSADIIRRQVVYRLINYDRNSAFLQDIPHRKVLDLALVYYVMVHDEKMGNGAIMMRDHFLEYYGITAEELDEAAKANTEKLLPADFIRMSDLLREFGDKTGAFSYPELTLEEESEGSPLYVLTNKARQYGAYYMIDPEVLKKISQKLDSDLFLLPSSVHECMILPAVHWKDPENLASMVREINQTQVSEEEYLGNSVYRYNRINGNLMIAA